MRLKTIKLAGFKSFVDPTSAHFPTNLSAVVGPNGCGKSNVIDAVRWVMGESSAKNLRGESMTDVIFNGSMGRKPVGQASIELIFDNADASLGGEYAQYAEISIKRIVTRDARSDYFLNNTRCRRKDITDIFLGTGLGPRSYAIIEQGMISRLIESKPEELRVYIEEAAGISKYKERRRETENRMRHTRDNLDRLNDVRDEMGRQLQHLEKQARDAEKYKELKEEERLLRNQLLALRWRGLRDQVGVQEAKIAELDVALEAAIASQREYETKLVNDRETQFGLSDEFNRVQSAYYQIGGDITRLQQAQRFREERLAELKASEAALERQLDQARSLREQDQMALETVQSELMNLEPALALLAAEFEAATTQLHEAEAALNEWQQRWDQFNQQSQGPRQRAEVEQSRIVHLEQSLRRHHERQGRLDQEQTSLNAGPLESELAALHEQLENDRELLSQDELRLEDVVEQVQHSRQAMLDSATEVDTLRQSLQALRGRESALEALQEAAAKGRLGLNQWLTEYQINAKPMAANLRVRSGWEAAVETVLGPVLHSVEVADIADVASHLSSLKTGQISLTDDRFSAPSTDASEDTLASCIEQGPAWLVAQLSAITTAENLAEALEKRSSLTDGQSFITPEGYWVGRFWLRYRAGQEDPAMGELARRRELDALQGERERLEVALQQAQSLQQSHRDALKNAEQLREQIQRELTIRQRACSEVQAQIGARQVRLEQFIARRERLSQDMVDVGMQVEADQESLAEARLLLQTALDEMTNDTREREQLMQARDHLRLSLDQARQQQRERRDAQHQTALQSQNLQARAAGLRSGLQRIDEQFENLQERREALAEQMLTMNMPEDAGMDDLETLLARHLEAEKQLAQVRDQVEAIQASLRDAEAGKARAEQQVQSIREQLQSLRMSWQEALTRREAQQEQLNEAGANLEELLTTLPEVITESSCQLDLERIGVRIARLGAINLAAIDEYQTQSERKVYLDQQDADLREALETLENAIRKIDRETRALFKETFEKVNSGLQELFPKVFGGGSAYLELTGDDLLEAGVTIMARPPGKRNSTIHLLSGGEKALTALSLVFSIFQLNPAPFCMLDEVDAPLDDANVGRFARLVEQMSKQVQFIYITHNKIAMEMAKQLMGVTMQEPGVSRLVTVNLDEAAALASQ